MAQQGLEDGNAQGSEDGNAVAFDAGCDDHEGRVNIANRKVIKSAVKQSCGGGGSNSCRKSKGKGQGKRSLSLRHAGQAENEVRKQDLVEKSVYIPLMSSEEIASIAVPASVPAVHLREVFARHGCVLVTDVLDQAQCDELENVWKEDLLRTLDEEAMATDFVAETLHCVQRDGLSAWPASWQYLLGSKGCASQRTLPHGRFSWAARLHPEVKRIFASLFDVSPEDLAVGLDVVFFAAADTYGPATRNNQWLHVDQNFRSGLTHLCAQGVLYIWPTTDEHASTTAVWPGSHLDVYDRLMQDHYALEKGKNAIDSQFVQINNLRDCTERDTLVAQAIACTRRVPCPAGSLLLWDSRTIHQGWGGGPRLAQPICWEPKSRRDDAARTRKLYCCATGLPTSHSSSEGRVHGMARRGRPKATKATQMKPAMKVTLPYCVAPGQEVAWQEIQDMLWPGVDPVENSKRLTTLQGAAIEAILRREVLDAL